MKTHDKILEAVRALADFQPLSITVPFRGYNVVFLDGCEIRAYKVGNCNPLVVKWEDLMPTEALMLKRACRYTLERQLQESNERLSALRAIEETFQKSPFGR